MGNGDVRPGGGISKPQVSGGKDLLPPLRAIARAYADDQGIADADSVRATVVSRRTQLRKQLVEIAVRRLDLASLASGEARLIGKRYTDRAHGAQAFATLRNLFAADGDGRSPLVVRPIAYLEEWSFLLTDQASGKTLSELVVEAPASTPSASLVHARRVAAWLRRLHAVPAWSGLPAPVASRPELRLTGMVRELAAAVTGESRAAVTRLGDRLRATGDGGERWRSRRVTLHGDLTLQSVFIDGDRVVGIDLDHAVAGDPAWEVGYVVGQLQCAALDRWKDPSYLDGVGEALVDAYLEGATGDDASDFRRRAVRYRALTLLENAHYRRCVLRLADKMVAPLVAEGERIASPLDVGDGAALPGKSASHLDAGDLPPQD